MSLRAVLARTLPLVLAALLVPFWALAEEPEAEADARGLVRFRYLCANELGRRDVTLFANGTVRLRQGLYEEETMHLAEIGRDELATYLELLGRPDPADDQPIYGETGVVDGPWVEKCELYLALPGRAEETLRFSRYDAPPLRVSRLVRLAEDLARLTRPERPERELPGDYQPQRGHLLRDGAGLVYRVHGLTSDGRGVELRGVEQPVVLYVDREELLRLFFAVETDPEP